MNWAIDGDAEDALQARELQLALHLELDRIAIFITKIESSIDESSSVDHSRWLHAQRDRQVTEQDRLNRMARALQVRFGI